MESVYGEKRDSLEETFFVCVCVCVCVYVLSVSLVFSSKCDDSKVIDTLLTRKQWKKQSDITVQKKRRPSAIDRNLSSILLLQLELRPCNPDFLLQLLKHLPAIQQRPYRGLKLVVFSNRLRCRQRQPRRDAELR